MRYRLHDKPVPVRPYEIGVSVNNRSRSVPNMRHCPGRKFQKQNRDVVAPSKPHVFVRVGFWCG